MFCNRLKRSVTAANRQVWRGAGIASWQSVGLAFAATQLYFVLRAGARVWLLASQTALFESTVPLAATGPDVAPASPSPNRHTGVSGP